MTPLLILKMLLIAYKEHLIIYNTTIKIMITKKSEYCTVSTSDCKLFALKWPLWRGYLDSWDAL